MPIFEYRCRTCEKAFEAIVLGEKQPECPACGGGDLQRLLSTFAVSSGSSKPPAPAGCGGCSHAGSCAHG